VHTKIIRSKINNMVLERIFRKLSSRIVQKFRSMVRTGQHRWYRNTKLARRVRANKERRLREGIPYCDYPKLSLIIQSFNHRQNVKPIIERLRLINGCEIIVCEDGSIDGSRGEWMKYLTRPNDFLICSNDLHEIRTYVRAFNLARGEIVCVLQDDDISPGDNGWVTQALELFEKYPRLAILGGRHGVEFLRDESGKLKIEGKDTYKFRYQSDVKNGIPFLDPGLKIPFMFVDCVNTPPTFFRKDAWIEIGGFDLSYSKKGEPSARFNYEICLKAWLKGWHVGLYERTDFKRRVGIQGTYAFSDSIRKIQIENGKRLEETYGDSYGAIRKLCDEANKGLILNPDYKRP